MAAVNSSWQRHWWAVPACIFAAHCYEKFIDSSKLVGRPSLAACRLAGTEARPTSLFILLREPAAHE